MNSEKMGQFIAELRKSRQMTQKELAEKLNITDKAVSKWERGLSCPDISLLASIADILGITITELLNGERSPQPAEEAEVAIDKALKYADQTSKIKSRSLKAICTAVFTALLSIAILVCGICDIAISGALTWSLFPISSIVFAWLITCPIIKYGTKGITGTLISLSIFLIPYLFILDRLLIKFTSLTFPIGSKIAVISIGYLWVIYAIFRKLKNRKILAASLSIWLAVPLYFSINLILAVTIAEPIADIWDLLGVSAAAAAAAVLLVMDFKVRKSAS